MKISDYMAQAELTEAQAAILFGCSQATVNKIKLGKQWPSPGLMRRIAEATAGSVMPNDFAGLATDTEASAIALPKALV